MLKYPSMPIGGVWFSDHQITRSPDLPIRPLCLPASYNNMDAAIPALSDSTREECGIVTSSSARDRMSAGKPVPSLPTSSANGPVRSALSSCLPLWDDVLATPTPCCCHRLLESFM